MRRGVVEKYKIEVVKFSPFVSIPNVLNTCIYISTDNTHYFYNKLYYLELYTHQSKYLTVI